MAHRNRGRNRAGTSTAAAEESPVDTTGLVGWYRVGVGITDTAGAVSSWADQSGEDHHLIQTTGTKQPALQGDGSILFDGTSDSLQALFTFSQPATVYVRFKEMSSSTGDAIFDGGTNNKMKLYQQGSTSYKLTMWNDVIGEVVNTIVGSPTSSAFGALKTMAAVWNGASSGYQMNSGTFDTGDMGSVPSFGGITLGSGGNGNNNAHIQVYEALVYSVAHDATARAAVIDYLATV